MSPIVEDGRCIVHVGPSTNGAVLAFDLATGQPQWKLILFPQSFCNTFDLTTGEPKWKWDGEGPANSSPVIMTVGGKKQLVILTAKKLVGLDLADGKLLWQVPFEANQGNNATPVVAGTTVFFTGQGKGLVAIKHPATGRQLHRDAPVEHPQFGARYTSPVLKDGFLYGSYNGHLFCANAQTGEADLGPGRQAWATPPPLWTQGRSFSRSAPAANCSPSSPEPHSPNWRDTRWPTTETWAHPVIAGNRIFVKDNETVALWTLE